MWDPNVTIFDIVHVRIHVYSNVETANGALKPKYVAEIGTYKTYPYKYVAYHVILCIWCGCV